MKSHAKYLVITVFLFLFLTPIYGQQAVIDSLKQTLRTASDEEKIMNLNKLAQLSLRTSNEKCIKYAKMAQELASKTGDEAEEGKAYYFLGFAEYSKANYKAALGYYQQSISIYEKLDNQTLVSRIYNDIGIVYRRWGKYDTAVVSYQKALKIQEKINDVRGKANSLSSIGNIYFYLGDDYLNKALEYYNLALDAFLESEDELGQAMVMTNIGLIYEKRGQYDSALDFINRSLEIYVRRDAKSGISTAYSRLGTIHSIKEEFEKAEDYLKKALTISRLIKNDREIPDLLQGLGEIYQRWGKNQKAIEYYKQSLQLFIERGQQNEEADTYKSLADMYDSLGTYRQALSYFRLHKQTTDSIYSQQMHKTISEMQEKYESEKKDLLISSQNQEIAQKEQEQFFYLLGLIVASIFVVVILAFSLLLLKQFRDKKKANVLLENQNVLLEDQNLLLEKRHIEIKQQRDQIMEQKQSITDSIQYARRIQNAVLPQEKYIAEILPEHFILFKPRDIVSGDYYWMTQKGDQIVIAAADCTGHGVPGAFMSMLGISFLNEIVNKKEVLVASEILEELRANVIRSLHQTGKENEAKDGMDIALCIINKKKKELQYSGAYNPLYYVRDGEIEQIKANKMPIGIYFRALKPFTNNIFEFKTGDTFYIFSDGFPDQFGGELGKKYMSKRFKEFLHKIHQEPMEEQKELLNNETEAWKSDLFEQTDDIVVIGFRL